MSKLIRLKEYSEVSIAAVEIYKKLLVNVLIGNNVENKELIYRLMNHSQNLFKEKLNEMEQETREV